MHPSVQHPWEGRAGQLAGRQQYAAHVGLSVADALTQVKSLRKQLEDAKAAAADEAKAPSAAPAPSMAEPAQLSIADSSPAAAGAVTSPAHVCPHRVNAAWMSTVNSGNTQGALGLQECPPWTTSGCWQRWPPCGRDSRTAPWSPWRQQRNQTSSRPVRRQHSTWLSENACLYHVCVPCFARPPDLEFARGSIFRG